MNNNNPIFDQLSLFPAEEPADNTARPIRRKARSYDIAVLRYVGYFRFVTLHQIVYRFFVFTGRGPGYGFRLVQSLVKRGLVESFALDQDLGSVSRQVCTLTKEGWAYLGLSEPKAVKRANIRDLHEYRLQFAESLMVREVEGWTLVQEENAWSRMREWGLAAYKGRALNDNDRMLLRRIENMPPMNLGLNILWHRQTKEIRLIIPVLRGKSLKRTIENLPAALGLFPPTQFELVIADPQLELVAEDLIKRWGEKTKIKAGIHKVPHFRKRVHPAQSEFLGQNLYKLNGVPDPRILL